MLGSFDRPADGSDRTLTPVPRVPVGDARDRKYDRYLGADSRERGCAQRVDMRYLWPGWTRSITTPRCDPRTVRPGLTSRGPDARQSRTGCETDLVSIPWLDAEAPEVATRLREADDEWRLVTVAKACVEAITASDLNEPVTLQAMAAIRRGSPDVET